MLVACLNSLHIRQYNKYYEEVRRIAAMQSGNRQGALDIARKAKPRLLVCAPSNAGVDNVILRIMEDGFVDGKSERSKKKYICLQSSAYCCIFLREWSTVQSKVRLSKYLDNESLSRYQCSILLQIQSMIRVGVGQSSVVRDVALSTKVDQILSETDVGQLDKSIAGTKVEKVFVVFSSFNLC